MSDTSETIEYKLITESAVPAGEELSKLAAQGWKPIMMSSVWNGVHIYAIVLVERPISKARYGSVR